MFARISSRLSLDCVSYHCSRKPMKRVFIRALCSKVPCPPLKRPLLPFIRFAKEHAKEVTVQQLSKPDSPRTRVSLELIKRWYDLSVEDKKVYSESFTQELHEYKAIKQQWWDSLSDEEKNAFIKAKKCAALDKYYRQLNKKIRLLGRPKRPEGAFYLFALEIKASPDNTTIGRGSFDANIDRWRSMSAEEKQPYFDKSREKFKEYCVQLNIWELQMMKNGHGDLLHQAKIKLRSKKAVMGEDDLFETSTDENE